MYGGPCIAYTRSWPPGRINYTASELKFLFLHPMAFKTSCQSVLYERDDVWTSVHCLKQVLGDQAGLNKIDLYQEKELF